VPIFVSSALVQRHNRRAPTPGFPRCVGKACNKRRFAENRSHHFALYPNSAAMDDPERPKAHPVRFFQIVLHHRFYLPWLNRVEIENVGYRDTNKLVIHD
jgi:hypothetical protein